MGVPSTISESKQVFHKEFPFVIPPIYRRLADELLVELHLLSHQTKFIADRFFAVGLCSIFDELTSGYKPEEHLPSLFEALCNCNGFNAKELRLLFKETIELAKKESLQTIINNLEQKEGSKEPLLINELIKSKNKYYSRINSIGILKILENSSQEKKDTNEIKLEVLAEKIGQKLDFSKGRIEKDLSLYRSNREKIAQAMEILEADIKSIRDKAIEVEKDN